MTQREHHTESVDRQPGMFRAAVQFAGSVAVHLGMGLAILSVVGDDYARKQLAAIEAQHDSPGATSGPVSDGTDHGPLLTKEGYEIIEYEAARVLVVGVAGAALGGALRGAAGMRRRRPEDEEMDASLLRTADRAVPTDV